MKPRLLDLYCRAGGSARGYARAGFDVFGVDMAPQVDYPYPFEQADALGFLRGSSLGMFDVIHASPPCQAYVQWQGINRKRNGSTPEYPDLIPPTRDLLERTGLPYVIENVVGAPLREPVLLCGAQFGLGVTRHRLFESNMLLLRLPHVRHSGREISVYGKLDGRRIWTREDGSELRAAGNLAEARAAMGIDWMEWEDLKEAVPPRYTQFLGEQLLPLLKDQPIANMETK